MAQVNERSTSSASAPVRRVREPLAEERLLEARAFLKEALREDQDNPELQRLQLVLAPPERTHVALNDSDTTSD